MAKNKNVRNRRQKSRKNSGLRWHKRGIVLTTLVIVLLGGMVTAGNASGINDGAAAIVVMSE